MSSSTVSSANPEMTRDLSRVGIAVTFVFGAIIVLAVGFLPSPEVHNAAHDTRHTAGFPCH